MKQNFTILFDLDGTLVDTAPDLMRAHNHVMKKFGYPTKSTEEIRNLVGQGAGAMLGRSIWGHAKKEFGNISVYARGQDYHKIIKKNLKEFGRWLSKRLDCDLKVFVDTAPVMEKNIAELAGLGWQGKHTNLVSKEFGSWLFLSEIFINIDLKEDFKEKDNCGT